MQRLQNGVLFVLIFGLLGWTVYDEVFRKPQPQLEYLSGQEVFNLDLPEDIDFCGEKVPLLEADIRERLDRELYVNVYWHSSTYLVLKRANRWFPKMREILQEEGVPEDFLYLCVAESGLQNVISPAGAVGFWQIVAPTGKELGLTINDEVDERYDPLAATRAACKYLKDAHEKFGTWTLAAASYNRGMNGLRRALTSQQAESYYDLQLNRETARYIFRILAIKEVLNHPEKYQFKLRERDLYHAEEMARIRVEESIDDLAAFAKQLGVSYRILKTYNPWLRENSLTVSERQPFYAIQIPKRLHKPAPPTAAAKPADAADSPTPIPAAEASAPTQAKQYP